MEKTRITLIDYDESQFQEKEMDLRNFISQKLHSFHHKE